MNDYYYVVKITCLILFCILVAAIGSACNHSPKAPQKCKYVERELVCWPVPGDENLVPWDQNLDRNLDDSDREQLSGRRKKK